MLENIGTALGIISAIVSAMSWIVSTLRKGLQTFIQTENAELSLRITNTQKQCLDLKVQNEMLRKQCDDLKIRAEQNRILLTEMTLEIRVHADKQSQSMKRFEKSSLEWLNAEYVRVKGGRESE